MHSPGKYMTQRPTAKDQASHIDTNLLANLANGRGPREQVNVYITTALQVKPRAGRTLSLLDTTVLLGTTPALLHLLTGCGLDGDQAEASLPVLGLKVLYVFDGVIDEAEPRGLATTELHHRNNSCHSMPSCSGLHLKSAIPVCHSQHDLCTLAMGDALTTDTALTEC